MNKKSLIQINLLKGRQKEERFKIPLIGSNRKIRSSGIFTGSVLVFSTLIACLFITIRGNVYKQRKESIESYALKYDRYDREIKNAISKIDNLYKFNKNLAKSIAGLKSSSAILTEISQIIPRSLTLDEIKIEDFSINITGKSEYAYGLKDINIFILKLEDSPFIKKYSTKLSHALESKENNSQKQEEIASISTNKLKFTITSQLKLDTSKITSNKLKKLGSSGLAHRIKLLNEEELLND